MRWLLQERSHLDLCCLQISVEASLGMNELNNYYVISASLPCIVRRSTRRKTVCSDYGPSSSRGKRTLSARKTDLGPESEARQPTKAKRKLSDIEETIEETIPVATPSKTVPGRKSIGNYVGPQLKERDVKEDKGKKTDAKMKAGEKRPAQAKETDTCIYDFVSTTDDERVRSPNKVSSFTDKRKNFQYKQLHEKLTLIAFADSVDPDEL